MFGGGYCEGDKRRYRVCNLQECPDGESYRDDVCSELGPGLNINELVGGSSHDVEWVAVDEGKLWSITHSFFHYQSCNYSFYILIKILWAYNETYLSFIWYL